MTIIDCCISLKMIKKNLVVLGVVGMRQLLLKRMKRIARWCKVVFFVNFGSETEMFLNKFGARLNSGEKL